MKRPLKLILVMLLEHLRSSVLRKEKIMKSILKDKGKNVRRIKKRNKGKERGILRMIKGQGPKV